MWSMNQKESPLATQQTHDNLRSHSSPLSSGTPNRPIPSNKKKNKNKTKNKIKPIMREKMKENDIIQSEYFVWKVLTLLGSGGFGDVYRVTKVDNLDRKDYAMKTEMNVGDKRLLRLKIEVCVLKKCHEQMDLNRKKHFVEFVDRGITDKFKFLCMGLVGPSLDDIRRTYLLRNYSKPTAFNACLQTLKAISDLHFIGYLHRDIKPANYAVGLNEKEEIIYLLDFGIARKIYQGNTRELKPARAKVKFLGTLRYASRACHHQQDQGRKDDLEAWLYMAFDIIDDTNGLPWKRAVDKQQVISFKEKFFRHDCQKSYRIVPKEFMKLLDYINGMIYSSQPDYKYIENFLFTICKDHRIDLSKKLDWIGKLRKKPSQSSSSDTSSDNRQSGSQSDSSSRKMKGISRSSTGLKQMREGKK